MIGFDYLGMGHKLWPTQKTISLTPSMTALGFFDSTFGDVIPALKKHLQSGKFPIIRVQLWWSDQHVICPIEVVKKRAPVYQDIAEQFPGVKVYISHSCEHNSKIQAEIKKRMLLIQELAPSCVPVNCPYQGRIAKFYHNEKHGSKVDLEKPYLVSTDGTNIYDINADKYHAYHWDAEIRFLWGLRYNLRENTKPGQKPPKPKDRTAIPSDNYLKAIIRLADPEGEPREPLFNARPIKEPLLYKSFAEDSQGQNIPRENRPLLISPIKSKSIDIVTWDKKVIGEFIHDGTFQNLSRHYSGVPGAIGLYGYEIGIKAKQASGSEWVWFRDKQKYYGPVNPAFRRGYFRD